MQTGENTMRCARKKKTNGCSHTFPRIHEIFQNLALKEKRKEEKPSNANADAGAIRFTDVHKYT